MSDTLNVFSFSNGPIFNFCKCVDKKPYTIIVNEYRTFLKELVTGTPGNAIRFLPETLV